MAGHGRTCDIFRLTTVYRQHGRAWRYIVDAVCISVYSQHGGKGERYTGGAGQQEGSTVYQCNKWYTCVRYAIYDIQTQYTTAITRSHHQSFATPGCVYRVCACVRYIIILLYYYNIIILLYLYIPNISSIPNIPNNGNIAL